MYGTLTFEGVAHRTRLPESAHKSASAAEDTPSPFRGLTTYRLMRVSSCMSTHSNPHLVFVSSKTNGRMREREINVMF